MVSSLVQLRRKLDGWRGQSTLVDLEPYRRRLAEILRRSRRLGTATDEHLSRRSDEIRRRAAQGQTPEELELEAFALVHAASSRTVGLHPFDVQVLAALALRPGHVVEMQTGEGKTLAAVFPATLQALAGRGVHVFTFNDYLARRDAAWMGPLYEFLGLSVAVVQEGMSPEQRRRAYAADITYLTAKQAGFDLLRGFLARHPEDRVQRAFHFALVDEADSLLIDEARVPLVIAGSDQRAESSSYRMTEVVRHLEPEAHYRTGEHGRAVDLTDAGRERAAELLGCGDLLAGENLEALTALHCALHAEVLLRRDVDYILRDGKIEQVDEFTGRVVQDRHWPDGLQAALHAKEGLARRPEGRVLGSITVRHLLKRYPGLCGMTGTAQSAADELEEFYGLNVVIIPPHRPCIRRDLPDVVFTHKKAKTRALVREIAGVHATGRPVLVGTASVAESDALAEALEAAGVRSRVLNARTDEREAAIIADAGALGALTISTNMAGRGTDIRLGGAREQERDKVMALGGLYVLGTNRHESLRIDRQLRGRAGRQGDPGSTRFFVSLEDDLIARYGVERLIPRHLRPTRQEGPLGNPVIRREIARAQRIVEGQNFEIRRTLANYSAQVEKQCKMLQRARDGVLLGTESGRRFLSAAPQRYAQLCAQLGEEVVHEAERQATLFHMDRRWSEHLELIADLREGIHLLRVGGQDPLTEFLHRAADSFHEMQQGIDEEVALTLQQAPISEEGLDREQAGLEAPTSTWTYLVNDDPFRDQLGIQLAGSTGVAAATALYAGPLLVLWGLYNRFLRGRVRRRRDS